MQESSHTPESCISTGSSRKGNRPAAALLLFRILAFPLVSIIEFEYPMSVTNQTVPA